MRCWTSYGGTPLDERRGVRDEVLRLAEERAERRRARDFEQADALRERIRALGYDVVDGTDGFEVAAVTPAPRPLRDVASVVDQPPTADACVHWLVKGWPEDTLRGIESFRGVEGERTVQHVVVDTLGIDPAMWPDDVEVILLEGEAGWGAERNAGLRRSRGRMIMVVDGSVEAAGDVFGPLEEALADPGVGLVGPFGIVTEDLHHFHESEGPNVDAVEGYLMAFCREVLVRVAGFDEGFRFYRTADIEFSFRVKDAGLRVLCVPVPVIRHEHRIWAATPPEERERLSKRNYYRFLGRFRDRFDLTVQGEVGPTGPGRR
jgi:Glycosyltransferase like family 2